GRESDPGVDHRVDAVAGRIRLGSDVTDEVVGANAVLDSVVDLVGAAEDAVDSVPALQYRPRSSASGPGELDCQDAAVSGPAKVDLLGLRAVGVELVDARRHAPGDPPGVGDDLW